MPQVKLIGIFHSSDYIRENFWKHQVCSDKVHFMHKKILWDQITPRLTGVGEAGRDSNDLLCAS